MPDLRPQRQLLHSPPTGAHANVHCFSFGFPVSGGAPFCTKAHTHTHTHTPTHNTHHTYTKPAPTHTHRHTHTHTHTHTPTHCEESFTWCEASQLWDKTEL